MQPVPRGTRAVRFSPLRLVGIALMLFASLMWWSGEYPRLVERGANPPPLVGPALFAAAVAFLVAALVGAIAGRSRPER
jgi:hypothetical protein